MNANNPDSETAEQRANPRRKRGCLFYIGRGFLSIIIALVTLLILGVAYQAAAAELDKRNYAPRGQLYSVNSHQMHLVCMGEGSPAVILQAGGAADSLWGYRVQNQLAEHTRVCAYDRPGYGWSEPAPEPRDATTITAELHTLLEQAGIETPYIMAGHSYGAVFTRIYAAQYPEAVAGIVLVDSSVLIVDHFDNQGAFDEWKKQWEGTQTIFGVLTRIGATRLADPAQFQASGYPADIAAELTALHARNQVLDTDYAEVVNAYWSLADASNVAQNLGDLPMAVLWASETLKAFETHIEGFRAAREEIPTYSSNSSVQIIEGADHGSILGKEEYARLVSDAVLKVLNAVQTGEPLAK